MSVTGRVFRRPEARTLVFSRAEVERRGLLARTPSVLDLDVLPARSARSCLRVPLTLGTKWQHLPRWFLGAGLRVAVPTADDGAVSAGFGSSVHGGVWLGPLRLRAEWLVLVAGNKRPPPAGAEANEAGFLGGALAVETFPFAWRWAPGIQAAWEVHAIDFMARRGSQGLSDWHFAHGPRLALRLARLPDRVSWPGFEARHDAWSTGFDLFVARWWSRGVALPTVVGIAFGGEWGRWF